MSKSRLRNVKSLQYWVNAARTDSKEQANKVLDLYQSGKMRDVTTARNLLIEFAASNSKTRGKANRRLQKIQQNIETHGVISQAAIAKKRRRAKKSVISGKIILYIKKNEKLGKEIAKQAGTRYFQGFRQTYAGNPTFDIHPDEVADTYEFLDPVKGKLIRAKEDKSLFEKMINDVLSTNKELHEYFIIRGYLPDAILLVSYTKISTEAARQHNPLEVKRRDTQHIGINSRYCLTTLDLTHETFEKAIYNSKYVKNQCWLNTLNDVYESNLLKQDKAPRYRISKEKILQILGKTEAELEEGLSIQDVVPFFEHFRLQLRVFNMFYQCIYKYDPEKVNHHYHALYCICKDEHVYTCNYEVKQLQQTVTCENPAELIKVTPHYRIQKDEEEFVEYQMFESVNKDLPRI